MKKITLIILLCTAMVATAQKKEVELQTYTFILDSVFSESTRGYRTLKIFLPQGYSSQEKYPVIYTLDAEWLFEPTVLEAKILMDFEVIPPSIVVGVFHQSRNEDLGINWQTGNLNPASSEFYHLLTQDLTYKIDSEYSTSGFNVLIGHSNSASFSHAVLTRPDQPFRGFVALSQNLFGNQLEEYARLTEQTHPRPLYYFVASGTRDATPRLESGLKLDSLFRTRPHPQIKTRHTLYNADHNGIPGTGLNNGIAFTFSDYKHFNDWDNELIDSLSTHGISSISFIREYAKTIREVYGVDFKVNQDDMSLMQVLTQTDEDIKAVQDFEIQHLGQDDNFYATYAQFYEYAKSYKNALDYWTKNLEGNYEHNQHFFYYRRPIELLSKKMDDPQQAIQFAQKWKGVVPALSQDFNLQIARIAAEHKIAREDGLSAIQEYINNYREDSPIDLEKAREIESTLQQ